jgi:hypothetical protein
MTLPNHLPSSSATAAADFVDHLCEVLMAEREQMLSTLGVALLDHRRRAVEERAESPQQ